MISYVDYAVTPGGRYGYRLANAATSDGAYYGETWVDVPLASEFALKGLRPNPTTHGFMIGFSLAESAPARLEVLDVGGRSVFAREVGTLGPGSHLIDLAERRIVPPGIYLVRLVQGVRALTARGVVIR
ncbi:MAG: T9SS type A sorting domain-containing protein [Candidatus Eisenbacteria bacterium]|nr:T9SS type A sorting domain-containing protein [Candidatus Eisenbacteria bacterium]